MRGQEGDRRLTLPSLSPTMLSYSIVPVALALILVLMHFHVVAQVPIWLWIIVFVVGPATSALTDFLCARNSGRAALQIRVAQNVAMVTAVTYLTGWGPVLVLAYAFVALGIIAKSGSRAWRYTTVWSLAGIAVGQAAISLHWAPTKLSPSKALALAVMGGVLLFFVIRMMGIVMEKKEEAESSLRLSEDRFRSLIQNTLDATVVISEDGFYTYVSPSVTGMLGFEPNDLLGKIATDFVLEEDRDRVRDRFGLEGSITPAGVFLQFRMATKGGGSRHVEAVVTDQRARPSVGGYVANIRDITERKKFEALLSHRALHDSLTGLANRQLTIDRADQMLARARRTGGPAALCFLDLDNFKDTNDSLGHEAGDKLLRAVSERLTGVLRSSDTVGRLGGDEFVILTEGPSLTVGPMIVADRIRSALRRPFVLEGFEGLPITVTASMGIATGDRASAQELLRDADIALYQAKAAGTGCCVLFEPAMQSAAVDRMELKSALYSALENDQFFLQYQPVFDLQTMKIRGVEALTRWNHPARGVILPDEFIPMLEDTGLIVRVGQWVLNRACDEAAGWHRSGLPLSMSVNVSMRQLETDAFVTHVKEALMMSGLDPGALVIEITESSLMRDADATIARLRQLKEVGVRVSIDDFGTGQSSLAYLRRFPVDELKIDRSFIAAMDGSAESEALIETLVELGRKLGLATVAEGIETSVQLQVLREHNCSWGQGFVFSRPADPEVIEQLLRNFGVVQCAASPDGRRTRLLV
jgi:diguanylate cyclase (GGDEF)-like protein/PAS domain S-box-containing protein